MSPRPEISESLFDLVAPESKLHVSFRDLARAQRFGAARSEMDRVFSKWGDCDSQFRRDFQTAGFDARVWELYLRAVLSDVELVAANSYSRPDFRCLYDGCEFFIEATTANESGNRAAPNSVSEYLDRLRDSTDDRDQLAIKFAGPLRSKLNRDYHRLDHVKGKPFTIAIQGFFDGALFCNVLPLVRYLLGVSLVD